MWRGHMGDKTTHTHTRRNALSNLSHWPPQKEEDLLNHYAGLERFIVCILLFLYFVRFLTKIIMHFLRLQYSIDNTLYTVSHNILLI